MKLKKAIPFARTFDEEKKFQNMDERIDITWKKVDHEVFHEQC